MDILLRLHVKEYPIESPIKTASGTIKSKKELLISFEIDSKIRFAIEIPLSPSSGESYEELVSKFDAKNYRKSEHTMNAISYFIGMHLRPHKLHKFKSELSYKTIGISDNFMGYLTSDIVKIKASPDSLESVKDLLINKPPKTQCVVDFNSSLSPKALNEILCIFHEFDIYGYEQPLRPGLDSNLVETQSNLYIADESLPIIGYDNLLRYGYRGFIFKTFRNSFNSLKKCNENKHNLFGVVGNNMSGAFDIQFSAIINEYMPVKINNYSVQSFFKTHPLNDENIYMIYSGVIELTTVAIDYLGKLPVVSSFTLSQKKTLPSI